MTELVIRPLAAGEEGLFASLPDPGLVGFGAYPETSLQAMTERGELRPEWSWIALRDEKVVARAAWWAYPESAEPFALAWFDFTDFDAAVAVLRAAPHPTEYSIKLPPGWREDPAVAEAATSRIAAAEAAGFQWLVERYLYRWTPDRGLPARPGRLEFRQEPDDEVFFDVLRRVAVGSLDAHTRRAAEKAGLDAAAREDLDIMLGMPGPREWWRLAYTPDGELVGLSLPSRNHVNPVIGFIGVVPEHRGHGYAYDLLVEATHLLVAEGADRIIAATDVPNAAMAATFAKAGYPVDAHRVDLI
ncbi:Acetyltransferase (GNAT) family protein [Amycolatopsis xylanica]|uniref:Acetyltransferase (GNAT) family protein n=1 Tax=Amycolatopsis xylanica TaxID=589385 RepID=A0A1H2V8J5_9PSEU|nr:GNAT family N-acetyltransferase [Amycolatopsis xylanica]SDW64189.1 Acetyltransferase (GNAT) family protein [Amycolatopsis xylanica]